jgi:hypothetical protein
MIQAIHTLSNQLHGAGADWLIGGSCGLIAQGVEVSKQPRDLDMYADLEHAEIIAKQLQPFASDASQYSETDIYRSVLSHYQIESMTLELVGNFQIISSGSVYTVEVSYLKKKHPVTVDLNGCLVPLMPLSHELIFNLLRGRIDRYEAIASVMREQPALHQDVMADLMKRNTLSSHLTEQIRTLLPWTGPKAGN